MGWKRSICFLVNVEHENLSHFCLQYSIGHNFSSCKHAKMDQEKMTKCNVDATTFNNNSIMRYFMCFRDSTGILGKLDYSCSSATFLEVESIDLLKAIKVDISNWIQVVLFETDSKTLSDALANHHYSLQWVWWSYLSMKMSLTR